MSTIAQDIAELNKSAKKIHGEDTNILVARAVAFGHDDNLILFTGTKHAQVAAEFAGTLKSPFHVQEEVSAAFMDAPAAKYTSVAF